MDKAKQIKEEAQQRMESETAQKAMEKAKELKEQAQ